MDKEIREKGGIEDGLMDNDHRENEGREERLMENDHREKGGRGRAWLTIVAMVCVIAVLASAATWFLFFNAGDNTEESRMYENIKRYQKEQMVDSLKEAMSEYLDLYNPDAFHYSEVKSLRDKLMAEETDWMDTERAMDVDALRTFIMVHPDGFYFARANACLDSLLALETKEEEDSIVHQVADTLDVDSAVEAGEVIEQVEESGKEHEKMHETEKDGQHHEVEIDSIFG